MNFSMKGENCEKGVPWLGPNITIITSTFHSQPAANSNNTPPLSPSPSHTHTLSEFLFHLFLHTHVTSSLLVRVVTRAPPPALPPPALPPPPRSLHRADSQYSIVLSPPPPAAMHIRLSYTQCSLMPSRRGRASACSSACFSAFS
jgi:hypothetical protein